MSTYTVCTQAELDAALKEHGSDWRNSILIDSPAGVWLEVTASGSSQVGAYGWSQVRAYNSSQVTASGSSQVTAYDSSQVRAYNSSQVRAYDSSQVRAYDSSQVTAGSFVAVHLHSARATVEGGVVIDLTKLDLTDTDTWIRYTGAQTCDESRTVVLYKAVDADLATGHHYRHTVYPLGQVVECSDWRDDNACGGGLHASPHPHQSLAHFPEAKRMLRVLVAVDDLRPIPGWRATAKAPRVFVESEVALDGSPLAVAR